MKDAYFFSHDSNARNDPKILAMRSVYGFEGYAWFFMIIEVLREAPTYRLPNNKYLFDTLSFQIGCDKKRLEDFIKDCAEEFKDENGALLCLDDYLYSKSLLRRMVYWDNKKEAYIKAAHTRWAKPSALQAPLPERTSDTDATHERRISDADATDEQRMSNAHANKLNKTIINKTIINKDTRGGMGGINPFLSDKNLGENGNGHKPEEPIKAFLIPEWIKQEIWGAFLETRKKLKAPSTEHALGLIVKELEKIKTETGDDPNEVLNLSIMRGWRGVFPLKKNRGEKHGTDREYSQPQATLEEIRRGSE